MDGPIRHVIVLMLENRSFDHLLGFAPQAGGDAFDGLSGDESNPLYPGEPPVRVSREARYALGSDADHSHRGVLEQLLGSPPERVDYREPGAIDCSGFAWSYERRSLEKGLPTGHGAFIMRAFDPENVPVLATLAREYALFDRWFASVPGETWPNRNYAHAATSHGKVDIELRPYWDETIFEQLQKADLERPWRIYHDGPAQVWAFPKLWDRPWRNRFHDVDELYRDIRRDRLPAYAFVEPNHGLIMHRTQTDSNSQHPNNNVRDGRDFHEGEHLVAKIYKALTRKPEVFRKTLLLVTYDEHGGFFDHVPPPVAVAPDDRKGGKESDFGHGQFGFDRLGVRVPAVAVSPWIRRGTVSSAERDHAAIPATLRALFAPDLAPLTDRDAKAKPFLDVLGETPRPESDWPEVKPVSRAAARRLGRPPVVGAPEPEGAGWLGPHERAMVALSEEVEQALDDEERLQRDIKDVQWWEPDEVRLDRMAREPAKLSSWLKHVKRLFRSRSPRED